MIMEKNKCSEIVFGSDAFHQHGCPNTGKIERDGKFYCGTHDPVAVKAKLKARDEKWDREHEERQAIRRKNKTLSPDTARELIEAASTVNTLLDLRVGNLYVIENECMDKLKIVIAKAREEMG